MKAKAEPTEAQVQARKLRAQKAARTRAANKAAREAQEAREAAAKATAEHKRLVEQEPDVYTRYEDALKNAMATKGDAFPAAWRKVEQAQQACINHSRKLRDASSP